MQCGMIGEPQIVTKPDDAGFYGWRCHQAFNAMRRYRFQERNSLQLSLGCCVYAGCMCVCWALEIDVKRYIILYLATLLVLVPVDFLFLGIVANPIFKAQVGDMLGDIRPLPAVVFYLLYVLGVLVFVNGVTAATWQSTLIYGALFGLFCYATFELTSMSLLKHWTWPVVFLDVSWGTVMTALSATAGLLLANWIVAKV